MAESKLRELSMEFSVDIINLVKYLRHFLSTRAKNKDACSEVLFVWNGVCPCEQVM